MIAVLPFPLGKKLYDTAYEKELVTHAIGFDGHVVSQIPALEKPWRKKMRLKFGDGSHQQFQLIPLVLFLLGVGADP